jgi:hypothetical protein
MYLADSPLASAWHHNYLMGPRTQTIYGLASKNSDYEYYLDWESKGTSILGLIGGMDHYVA